MRIVADPAVVEPRPADHITDNLRAQGLDDLVEQLLELPVGVAFYVVPEQYLGPCEWCADDIQAPEPFDAEATVCHRASPGGFAYRVLTCAGHVPNAVRGTGPAAAIWVEVPARTDERPACPVVPLTLSAS